MADGAEPVVLVTGAAQGIGAAVVADFAAAGHPVAAVDVAAARLRASVADLAGVRAFPADVTVPAQVDAAVGAVEDAMGPIGVLVNGAGVLHTGDVVDLSDERWAATFAVNAAGVFATSRAVARRMVPRRAGAIVTVSSNAGATPRTGMAAYCASKAAATMFTKVLGLELAEHGIRCNVVAPGSTDTPMLRGMVGAPVDEGWADAVVAGTPAAFKVGIPLRKLATPQDIAAAVRFLASPAAGHITMQELLVDGGAALGG